jgi:hypothetical protein
MLVLRGLIGGLAQLVVLAALLLMPAGTWHWPRAVHFLVVYGLVNSVSIVALARLAPTSLEARPVRLVGMQRRSPALQGLCSPGCRPALALPPARRVGSFV